MAQILDNGVFTMSKEEVEEIAEQQISTISSHYLIKLSDNRSVQLKMFIIFTMVHKFYSKEFGRYSDVSYAPLEDDEIRCLIQDCKGESETQLHKLLLNVQKSGNYATLNYDMISHITTDPANDAQAYAIELNYQKEQEKVQCRRKRLSEKTDTTDQKEDPTILNSINSNSEKTAKNAKNETYYYKKTSSKKKKNSELKSWDCSQNFKNQRQKKEKKKTQIKNMSYAAKEGKENRRQVSNFCSTPDPGELWDYKKNSKLKEPDSPKLKRTS